LIEERLRPQGAIAGKGRDIVAVTNGGGGGSLSLSCAMIESSDANR
jgi:hypothetical protein